MAWSNAEKRKRYAETKAVELAEAKIKDVVIMEPDDFFRAKKHDRQLRASERDEYTAHHMQSIIRSWLKAGFSKREASDLRNFITAYGIIRDKAYPPALVLDTSQVGTLIGNLFGSVHERMSDTFNRPAHVVNDDKTVDAVAKPA